jgi:CDGSH-type Zn-finger protein
MDQLTTRFSSCGASKDTPLCDKSLRQTGFDAQEPFVWLG